LEPCARFFLKPMGERHNFSYTVRAMEKIIVLAEKPSVGREIARVLGCHRRQRGYCEGGRYIVTWAMGHLVELAEPAAYNPAYKRWSLSSLPMLPAEMKLQVIPRTKDQYDQISSLLKRPDAFSVVIATDAGREGELVARWILQTAGWKGPVQRLWISSQTDSAIEEGFKNLIPGEVYEHLFQAAETRAEADWIVGMNVTRTLTCRHDTPLSAGRVQTPTLAMIVEREEEIEKFTGSEYFTVKADFEGIRGSWKGADKSGKITDQSKAEEIARSAEGQTGKVLSVQREEKTEQPPLAYDLTELQREANLRLEFSAKKTLDVLQGLYERHKIVTYPRTDSRYLSNDIVPTLPARLLALQQTPYGREAKEVLAMNTALDARLVNDRKVTDHHAIIPTEEPPRMGSLSADESALYELIVRRFLEVLSPSCRYQTVKLSIEAAGERFEASASEVKQPGWKQYSLRSALQDSGEAEELSSAIGSLKEGELRSVSSVEVKREYTRPPARYTEATLLSAMEHAGRFIEDARLKRSIAGSGIGTPATRADIIEKLLAKYYIEREGRYLKPTAKGRELIHTVPGELRSPELTARWEERLARIAQGDEEPKAFSRDIRRRTEELVSDIKASTAVFSPDYPDAVTCPACGGQMMRVQGKKDQVITVCQSLSCGYEEMNGKPTKKAKAMERRAVKQHAADRSSSDTATFADLIKASQERKQRKRR